jgi:flagellar biosynthesis/type III secretory pathway protein FliH
MRSHGGPWERGYPDVFGPAEQGNLAAALIQLENSRAPEELRRGIQLLVHWLHAPEQASLRRAFTVWLGRVLLPGKLKGVDLPALNELEEVDAMLAERVKEWTREWEQQGLLKGLQQGREQGRKEGEVELLKKQLLRKFGPLSPQTEQRLEQAGPDELLEWGEKVLFAASIEQVFDDE